MPVSPAFWLTKFKLRGALQIKSMTYEAQCRRCWEPSGIVCAQTGASHPSLRVERFSLPRNQPLFPQKGHFDRANALTVRLLWMLWIAVEKAQNAPPPLHNHHESSASLQLKLGFPPRNWFVARNSTLCLRILYSARPY
jgi:hypothetical protein